MKQTDTRKYNQCLAFAGSFFVLGCFSLSDNSLAAATDLGTSSESAQKESDPSSSSSLNSDPHGGKTASKAHDLKKPGTKRSSDSSNVHGSKTSSANQTTPNGSSTSSASGENASTSKPDSKAPFIPELKAQTPHLAPLDANPATSTAPQAVTQQKTKVGAGRSSTSADSVSTNSGRSGIGTEVGTSGAGQSEEDHYPTVAQMETLSFGKPQSQLSIEDRLSKLENSVYQKTFSDLSLFDRTEQLKKTLLGGDDLAPAAEMALHDLFRQDLQLNTSPPGGLEADYFDALAQRPENQQKTTIDELKVFALKAINYERGKIGLAPLELDEVAEKVATEQVAEMCNRNVISHSNAKGDNPDRRYTIAGGNGAVTESILSNKTPDTLAQAPTHATVINLLKIIMSRQDDHDAIMNPDATHIGFALDWAGNKDKVIAAVEVVTKHGIIHPLPTETRVGDKLDVKGVVLEPYKFERVTLAWEANHNLASAPDDGEEALPYFPPLDYVAYAHRSEHDYSTAMGALRTAGIVAAIAGGMFMPPVALAAPMIAMSGGMGSGEPKPVSDIPVHGGVKVEGATFSSKIPLNKEGKEGIYYVTIWATNGKYAKPVPISRQAIFAHAVTEDVSAKVEPTKHKKEAKENVAQ